MKNTCLILFFAFFSISFLSAQCISGNCKNGTGIFIYPSGAKYIGEFKDGEIHGIGVCYYTDGSKYQGEWVFRYPQGNGTMTFPDGSKWTGHWKRGHPINKDGEIIEDLFAEKDVKISEDNIQSGCISGDCENGTGTYAYANGSKYEGQFSKGTLNGEGTFHFADGDKYTGAFKNGYSHGKGTFHHRDGTVTKGEWKDGEYIGNPIIANGSTGCIEGNCENGKGTYIYKNGAAKYVGEFKNLLPHGKGAIYYSNGERYTGDWKEGSFEGSGTLYLLDGTEVNGLWKAGTYMGKEEREQAPPVAQNEEKPREEVAAKEEQEALKEEETIPFEEETDSDLATEVVQDEGNNENEPEKDPTPRTEPTHYDTQADIIAARKAAGFKVWAVVVGVSMYNHMPTLRYTDDDAYRMYAFLKSPEGGALTDDQIRILIDEDATRENIESTMRNIFGRAGENDLILLYFSGHGLKGSFLPIDYDGFNNKLQHEEINAILDESPAKFKLCIADACHSGSILAMKSGEVTNALENYYKALASAKAGTALLMSSKSDETSLESSGFRQGVFSHFLIRGLKGEADVNGDKLVTIRELYDFINTNVRNYTGNRQSPLLRGEFDENMTVAVTR